MATTNKSPKLSEKEALAIVEQQRQERIEGIKNFFTGMAKAVTTDLPGFLMDFADKLAGDTATFGEKDRSAQLFEAMTGIKTASGKGGVDELVGSMVNPVSGAVGIGKAIIVPAILKDATKYGEAVDASIKGMRGPELWKNFGVFPDPATGQLKSVISDEGASFSAGVLKPPELGYQSSQIADNPKRVSGLAQSVFETKSLAEVLDNHPELFATIPDLANVRVRPLILSNALGSYDPADDVIRLAGGREPNDIFSTVLHEVQHAVQKRAGTQGGGNSGMFFEDEAAFKASAEKARTLTSTLRKEFETIFKDSPGLEGRPDPYIALKVWQEDIARNGSMADYARKKLAAVPVKTLAAFNQVQEAQQVEKTFRTASDMAFINYRNLLGEAEARLVQTQHKLGDYTTYPPELMAKELGVSIDALPSVLITDDILPTRKVDTTDEIKEAMAFVEQLMQSRSSSAKK